MPIFLSTLHSDLLFHLAYSKSADDSLLSSILMLTETPFHWMYYFGFDGAECSGGKGRSSEDEMLRRRS